MATSPKQIAKRSYRWATAGPFKAGIEQDAVPEPPTTNVIDLIAALRRSIAATEEQAPASPAVPAKAAKAARQGGPDKSNATNQAVP